MPDLTIREVARECNISYDAARLLIISGAIKSYLIGTRTRRVTMKALDEYRDGVKPMLSTREERKKEKCLK